MTVEELKKATGQELINARDYCGVDGYFGEYLKDINKEMLERFNQLEKLKKENAELKAKREKILNYLAYKIPHKLMNEATNKIWGMI